MPKIKGLLRKDKITQGCWHNFVSRQDDLALQNGDQELCIGKSWIMTELFESWLSDQFLANAIHAWPLLLILDGHSTHNQPEVICYATCLKAQRLMIFFSQTLTRFLQSFNLKVSL